MTSRFGFTLAELLIALVILGVIATFTIPKVLSSQQDSKKNAIAKETVAMVSEAYQIYKSQNTITAATSMYDFVPYLNYVKEESSISVDHRPPNGTINCSAGTNQCLLLHNGAILWHATCCNFFNGTAATDRMTFLVDVDGQDSGGDPNGKAVEFMLFTTGRVTTRGVESADPTKDPVWFKWD